MYIYHWLINALNAHIIHINLNMIFYTHVEHSPMKNNLHKVLYGNTHTPMNLNVHIGLCAHAHTYTHTHTHTHNPELCYIHTLTQITLSCVTYTHSHT